MPSLRRPPLLRARFLTLAVGFGLTVLTGWGVHHVFSRLMRYEIPSGFKGWFVVEFEELACPPLRSEGLFLVVAVPASGRVCTSTANPDGLVYYKFEYVSPDGRKGRGPRRTSFHLTQARHSAGEMRVPGIERCASSSTSRQSSKMGAVCGNAARTVLCEGRSAMIVPTATM